MTTLAGAPLALDFDQDFALDERDQPRASDGDGLTLASKLANAWEGLLAAGVAVCPVCGARMKRIRDDARCGSCGSTLS